VFNLIRLIPCYIQPYKCIYFQVFRYLLNAFLREYILFCLYIFYIFIVFKSYDNTHTNIQKENQLNKSFIIFLVMDVIKKEKHSPIVSLYTIEVILIKKISKLV